MIKEAFLNNPTYCFLRLQWFHCHLAKNDSDNIILFHILCPNQALVFPLISGTLLLALFMKSDNLIHLINE